MNWDTLQENWQRPGGFVDASGMERLLQSAMDRDRKLHRVVKRRDLIETSVALLIAPFFAFVAWVALSKGLWITGLASLLLVASCLYIPWRLRQARKLQPDPEMSADMLAYFRAERVATQAQYELLSGILGWYLGPLGVGVILFFFGVRGWSLMTLYYTLAVGGLYGAIYLGNQRAATQQFAPRIKQIDEQIHELQGDA